MNVTLKPVFRHLWNKRLFTLLNVIGLAIGISSCWMIYGIVKYEYSFDKPLPERENIYRLSSGYIFDEKESFNAGASKPIYQGLRAEAPLIKRVVPVFGQWVNSITVPAQPGRAAVTVEDQRNIAAVDSLYFDMVEYQWLAGNPVSALTAPENVVLTESRAQQYFPGVAANDVMGRVLMYNDTTRKVVTGVVKDLPFATDFTTKEFLALQTRAYPLGDWTNTNGSDRLYLQLAANTDTAKVMAQVNRIVGKKTAEFYQTTKVSYSFKRWFELNNLAEIHFASHINDYETRTASKPVMYGLIALGGFILLLACINYINLSTAQIPQRSKEIAVRKTLGSGRGKLVTQLLFETLIIVAMASLLALLLARLGFNILSDIIPKGSENYGMSLGVILAFAGIVLLVSLFSGIYPAWLMARVRPIAIMRGKSNWSGPAKSFSPRKALIVLQFVIAQVFIVGALIMGSQMQFLLKQDLGFNRKAVASVTVPWKFHFKKNLKDKQFVFANEIRSIPGVEAMAMGDQPMREGYSSSHYNYFAPDGTKTERQLFRKTTDTAWMALYGIQLLAGRNIRAADTTAEYVINETAVKAFGFKSPQDAIGKLLEQDERRLPIVGVIKDFHSQNFHSSIDPMVIMTEKDNLSTVNIRLSGTNPKEWTKTMKAVEAKWNSIYPAGSFEYHYFDETLANMYATERNMSRLVNLATVIAILISCLGLFGLATLTALQRTKEIGIRKVLGSSVTGIVRLLSTDFFRLIIIALVIATPLAWWAMNEWLRDFAYRISIQWWMFVLAGLAAIVIAFITISYQSIRAAVSNPVDALRDE